MKRPLKTFNDIVMEAFRQGYYCGVKNLNYEEVSHAFKDTLPKEVKQK